MGRLEFEDMQLGARWETGALVLTDAGIREFAETYDPQALHLDEEWAREGPFGGIIASGFQTLALAWSLWIRLGVLGGSSRGGIGLDELRWTLPVRPGDTIRAEAVVVERSVAPRKGRGRVVLQLTVCNQRSEVVLTFRALCLVAAREG